MEGYFYSYILPIPKRILFALRFYLHEIERYFFVLYVDHFHHVPYGDIWDNAFGYAEETAKIIASLARRANANVALVGQKGVGSVGIAKEVASRIHTKRAHIKLNGKRVLFVHIDELLSGAAQGVEQLHALENVVSQMERSGMNIAVLSGMEGVFAGNYKMSAEDVLYPFFASPYMNTITILSDEEYREFIAANEKLAHYVEKIHIRGLDSAQTKEFLTSRYRNISQELLERVISKSESISPLIPYPKRAVQILQELAHEKVLQTHHVDNHVFRILGVDAKRLYEAHRMNIREALGRHIVNQERAKKEIHNACIRAQSNSSPNRSLLSLLLSGPSGVGKRETACAMAQLYFGSKQFMISVNMANFAVGEFSKIITEHPACVLFLENFSEVSEQAHGEILSALTNGYILDAYGRKYFTTHMIVIATTSSKPEDVCSTELLESFDGVVTFVPLSEEHVQEIARRKLARLNGNLQIEHDVSLDITDELIAHIAQHGYSEQSGAHAMDGVIHTTVENKALDIIRQGKVVPGGKIRINPTKT
ncbi:MAG: hypothetical protein O3A36_01575 [bacterium]|nr:hypothetical protein [bacterium]